jgi:ribosomal protein S18 acetylase RimI-like enzyme
MKFNSQTAGIMEMIRIRPLGAEDLTDLEWEGEYSHFRTVYQNTYQRCLDGKALSWVAIHPEQGLIGQVFVQLECDRPELADGKDRAYMFSFRIKPEHRNRGLGSRILEILETEIRKRGYTTITLNVSRDNNGAIRLYERNGYKTAAADPGRWSYPDENGCWHEVEEPSWRMEKNISKSLLVKKDAFI